MRFTKYERAARERDSLARLLRTKLAPPLARPGSVPRRRLEEWLRDAAAAKLVLINAPAGFGKTTVMLQWLARVEEQGRRVAWLTVDEGDNDEMRFITYLSAALRPQAQDIGGSEAPEIALRPTAAQGLLDVIDWITTGGVPFTLFLDDFEVIHNTEIHDLLREILDCLPANGQVVLASRENPQLPLARMRARRQLLRLGVPELRFAREEADQFFRCEAQLGLTQEDVVRLHTYTEGWAAGLQLASLALAGREDRKKFIRSFSGSFRDIADYLSEDVLSRQPDEVREFLLKTSILERLSGPLCDALTGRTDGEETLSYLERANLFISPLDDERRWYRYHNLFAQFLRARLERGFWDRLAGLHTSASKWFEERGRLAEAAEHALSAGDLERAANLMAQCSRTLVRIGQVRTVADWCERLPRTAFERATELRVDYCWALAFRNRFEEARAVISQILAGREAPLPAAIEDELLALQGVILVFEDRVDEAQEASRTNLPRVSDRGSFAYGTLGDSLGFCLISQGQFGEAERLLARLKPEQMKAGGGIVTVYSDCLRGLLRLMQGKLREGLDVYRSLYNRVTEEHPQHSVLRAVAAGFLSEALYEVDELAEAEAILSNGLTVIREHRPLEPIIFSYRTLARICFHSGREAEAEGLLDEADGLGSAKGASRLAATIHQERIRLALQAGDSEAAERLAAERGDPEVWASYTGRIMPASDPDTPEVIRLRLAVRTGRAAVALPQIRSALERAESSGRARQALTLQILEAEALDASGERKAALRTMRKAVEHGAREGFIRAFADEAVGVCELIRVLRDTIPDEELAGVTEVTPGYLDRILTASGVAPRRGVREAETESVPLLSGELTKREVEVLQLSAIGLSNQDIADRIFLSVGTVKFHLGKINMKLGAKNRTQALLKARQRGLIP